MIDPRARVELGDLRVCGVPRHDEGAPDSADVVAWEIGEAVWAKNSAAIRQSGTVIIERRSGSSWREVRRVRPPQPAAYGHFGLQLASNGQWLAVLAERPQNVWIVDLKNLEAPPQEIEGARGFAKAIAVLDDQVVIGGVGEARVYRWNSSWTLTAQLAAPPDGPDTFTGQIVAQDDLIVSTASGVKDGDGGALPGRIDVYRRLPTGWQWESQLTPTGHGEPFGGDCCVAIKRGEVSVAWGDERWQFTHGNTGWHAQSKGGNTP